MQRVATLMVHPPFSVALEKFLYPDEQKIIDGVKRAME